MNKTEFLDALRHALGKLPSYEVEQSIAFYAEMIDDRIEDGMSEQEAVAALGSVHAIAAQIVAETPPIPKAIAKANTGSRTLNIVLLALCSPIWLPLCLALVAAALLIWLAIWLVIAALIFTDAVFILMPAVGILALVTLLAEGHLLTGIFLLGGTLAASGFGLAASIGVAALARQLASLTRAFIAKIVSLFVKRKHRSDADRKEAPHA